jgi:Toprim domain
MMDLLSIARALGGRICGRNRVLCPGPGHNRCDRSLSVTLHGDELVVHSFAGDDWRECKDYVTRTLALPKPQPSSNRSDRQVSGEQRQRQAQEDLEDELARTRIARSLWDRGIDARGTDGEHYLRPRKLELTDAAALVLRFHPKCAWHGDWERPEYPPGWWPTLLAAFQPIDGGDVVAVHRIRVDQPQFWPKTRRKMLGPVRNAAIKLASVTDTLAVAEGVETAIAANLMGHGPAWALGSAGAIANLPVLPGIKRLVLLAEHNETSRAATDACGKRWLSAGRKVTRIWPDQGHDDLNDELISRGASDGAR